jgi:hypothetical protein
MDHRPELAPFSGVTDPALVFWPFDNCMVIVVAPSNTPPSIATDPPSVPVAVTPVGTNGLLTVYVAGLQHKAKAKKRKISIEYISGFLIMVVVGSSLS